MYHRPLNKGYRTLLCLYDCCPSKILYKCGRYQHSMQYIIYSCLQKRKYVCLWTVTSHFSIMNLKGNLLLMKKILHKYYIIRQIFQLIIVLWSKMYVAFTVRCGDVIKQISLNDPLFLVWFHQTIKMWKKVTISECFYFACRILIQNNWIKSHHWRCIS